MKIGQESFEALFNKLQDQRDNMRDYLTTTKSIAYHTDENGVSRMTITTGDNKVAQYGVTELAQRQIAERLKIPYRYYDLMRVQQPTLLDQNVNTWFDARTEKRFVRTLYGDVRAFLSDRYQRIDNLEIAFKVLQILNEQVDWAQASCEVTDNHLYIKVISNQVKEEVVPGDLVKAGFVVSNSEVGLGCVKVEPLVYRMVCSNGMIIPDQRLRKYHVGQRQGIEDDFAIELFREETIAKSNEAFLMKVEDILHGALNEKLFRQTIERFRIAKQETIDVDPVETVKTVGDNLGLNEEEKIKVSANYLSEEDYTKYGLANAITKTANTMKDYERATDFERLGGDVLMTDLRTLLRNVDSRKVK